jgi:hypothetical protein
LDQNNTVRKFQTAKLDEWIGDYESADKIYEEIQNLDDKLLFVFKNTINRRQSKLNSYKEKHFERKIDKKPVLDHTSNSTSHLVKNNVELLYDPDSLKPKKNQNIDIAASVMKWKYSVSVISKVENDLQIEIRGYIPEGVIPQLSNEFPKKIADWDVEWDKLFSETIIYLIELNAFNKEYDTQMYLSIDKWGLIRGTIVVDESKLGDILSSIHVILSNLSAIFLS